MMLSLEPGAIGGALRTGLGMLQAFAVASAGTEQPHPARWLPPPPTPPPRTKWTRRVPHPVLIGHAASLTPPAGSERRGRSGSAPAPAPLARYPEAGRSPPVEARDLAMWRGARGSTMWRAARGPLREGRGRR